MKKITTILSDMYGVIIEENKGNFIPYTFSYSDSDKHEKLIKQFKEPYGEKASLTASLFCARIERTN